jgi:phage shock protein B
MSDNLTAVLIVLITVLGPVWITFHFVGKSRASRQLNQQDVFVLDQLNQNMARMENRIATLERILDTEVPGWRANPNLSGQYHGTMG